MRPACAGWGHLTAWSRDAPLQAPRQGSPTTILRIRALYGAPQPPPAAAPTPAPPPPRPSHPPPVRRRRRWHTHPSRSKSDARIHHHPTSVFTIAISGRRATMSRSPLLSGPTRRGDLAWLREPRPGPPTFPCWWVPMWSRCVPTMRPVTRHGGRSRWSDVNSTGFLT
jgi:hypothetical protein